jgi:hypothetical protein
MCTYTLELFLWYLSLGRMRDARIILTVLDKIGTEA